MTTEYYNLISGGYDGNNYLSTSEIFEDGSFKAGPDLPVSVARHCMVMVNETHTVLTGGYGGGEQVHMFKEDYER